jgi:putative ABC transport system permease protein
MDGLLQDLRFGWRMLWRNPGFAAAALLAIGLGVGATTAIFTVLDRVVLRPLPYPDADRLVVIWETNEARGLGRERLSPVNFGDYRALSHVFEDAAAWWHPQVNLTETGREPMRVRTVEASANLFRVIGVTPVLGLGFQADALFARDAVAVISHRLWRDRFGSDADIVGKPIVLAGQVHTVTGVMPEGFGFPGETDVWQRLTWDMAQHSRGAHFMESLARLRPGTTVEAAASELRALTARLGREHTATNGEWSARVLPLVHDVAGDFRPALLALFGAAFSLLLIACTNVGSLLLARASVRGHEVALRAALGARRVRIVRQLLTESAILALLGTLTGLAFSAGAVKLLLVLTPVEVPRLDTALPDWRVLGFAAVLSVITAVAFGLAPAIVSARGEVSFSLKEGGRGSSGSAAGRLRNALVVAEVALAVMLLVGAALLARSFAALAAQDPGFTATSAVTVNVEVPVAQRDFTSIVRFYDQLLTSLRDQVGVQRAGASNFLPFEPAWRVRFLVNGRPPPPDDERPIAQHQTVDEEYFPSIGAPLVRGRLFTARDTREQPGVVIVNQTLAREWPNEDPIGQRITTTAQAIGPMGRMLMPPGTELEVVGVVADVRNGPLGTPPEPALYFPFRQFPFRGMHLVVQGDAPTEALVAAVRRSVEAADPTLPLAGARTLDGVLSAEMERPRALTILMSAFALLALVLSAIGVYGVLSYAVSQRRVELCVRMALGASPAAVMWLVARHAARLTAAGAMLGLVGALALGRTLSGLLYGVDTGDATALVVALAVSVLSAAAACLLPARRAASSDLANALRSA